MQNRLLHMDKALHWLSALGLAGAGVLSLFLWRETTQAVKLTHMEMARLAPLLAAPLPEKASALWLDAWSARALEQAEPSSETLVKARKAIQRALSKDPKNVALWNRLAYTDLRQYGYLTPEGKAALRRSFRLSPYGGIDLMRWRLDLASALWPSLDKTLQEQCLSQIAALARKKAEHRWLEHLAQRTKTPALRQQIEQTLARRKKPASKR